ncbi:DALR anticodon-binding domain-containing protein 3 isoform X1 [Carcharodon carcharias]|uniref:DALR anticodon-binding domain-containing protein 3 isoform X1 n=1 Tax=Carcharodon carcharias TaxID=13397 RepID=UPI001B7ECC71|nr:DALR anticodon-binding domain-containing protein 3 isoform X1 [Carcharodon carcharias]
MAAPAPDFSLAGCWAALEAALRGPCQGQAGRVWFKESSGRNLRGRDWIAPRAALGKLYPRGQVPEDLIERLMSECRHRLYIQSCKQTDSGLVIRLDRPALFMQVLSNLPFYTRTLKAPLAKKKCVILNCVALQGNKGPESLTVSHLRTILLVDHLAVLLRQPGYVVHTTPNLPLKSSVCNFLKLLRVTWPSTRQTISNEGVSNFKKILSESIYTQLGKFETPSDQTHNRLPKDVLFKVHLRQFVKEKGLEGYDANLDMALVQEEALRQIAELQNIVLQEDAEECLVIHVVGCEEEFQQQKIDLLWRILDTSIDRVTQRHLVCGPVKITGESSHINAVHYFQFRRSQMQEASVMKYGNLVQGDSWSEIIGSMTSATIRFELLATAHRSPLNLEVTQAINISTKGTKSGAFVMYNCARLATLFDHFNKSVQQGLYPKFPEISQLNFSALQKEGEWLLLYNYIIPFREVLCQTTQSLSSAKGIRLTISTEIVCKFLVNLSIDFSSYYNHVHILGEPLEHLFNQMFARLQLMKALREVFHSALSTLHITPPNQL